MLFEKRFLTQSSKCRYGIDELKADVDCVEFPTSMRGFVDCQQNFGSWIWNPGGLVERPCQFRGTVSGSLGTFRILSDDACSSGYHAR